MWWAEEEEEEEEEEVEVGGVPYHPLLEPAAFPFCIPNPSCCSSGHGRDKSKIWFLDQPVIFF